MDFSLLLVTIIYLSSNQVRRVISVLWALITSTYKESVTDWRRLFGAPYSDGTILITDDNLTSGARPDDFSDLIFSLKACSLLSELLTANLTHVVDTDFSLIVTC